MPISLLKAIIALGGKDVSERKWIDAIWPDEEGSAGKDAFTVSRYRLRKLLVRSGGASERMTIGAR